MKRAIGDHIRTVHLLVFSMLGFDWNQYCSHCAYFLIDNVHWLMFSCSAGESEANLFCEKQVRLSPKMDWLHHESMYMICRIFYHDISIFVVNLCPLVSVVLQSCLFFFPLHNWHISHQCLLRSMTFCEWICTLMGLPHTSAVVNSLAPGRFKFNFR